MVIIFTETKIKINGNQRENITRINNDERHLMHFNE